MVKIIHDRDRRILDAAIKLAESDHYNFITRDAVATAACVAPGTINNVFGTMRDLKRAVLAAAVERENLTIIAQGLGDAHEIVMAAPDELRRKAALSRAGVA